MTRGMLCVPAAFANDLNNDNNDDDNDNDGCLDGEDGTADNVFCTLQSF